MLKRAGSSFLLALMLAVAVTSAFSVNGVAWSNGGYTVDPTNPKYGTHDWIAEHALDWVPSREKEYISSNLEYYFYGTELPDNGNAPDGIGDSRLHHIYFNSERNLVDDEAALRASDEFYNTLDKLASKDFKRAAEHAGAMTHYIADMAVFAHVMGSGTLWGPEKHHNDYEDYVNRQTSSYNSTFNAFLVSDGLNQMNPYEAAMSLAYITCFDNVTYTALWMDQNYNWSNPKFVKQVGESLNLAVNYIADVLHALYLKSEAQNQQSPSPPSDSYPSQPTFPPVVVPLWVIGMATAVIALTVTIAVARSRPRHPRRRLVRLFWNGCLR